MTQRPGGCPPDNPNEHLSITAVIIIVQRPPESRDRRKGGQTGTPRPGADTFTGPSRSEVPDARNWRKHERWYGVPLHRKGRGG